MKTHLPTTANPTELFDLFQAGTIENFHQKSLFSCCNEAVARNLEQYASVGISVLDLFVIYCQSCILYIACGRLSLDNSVKVILVA